MKHQTDTSGNREKLPTKITNETFVTMDTKNVNKGLKNAQLGIPPTISEAVDIIKNVDDENERTYVTTACSRCQKRHIKCDNQKPSCQNCDEKKHECVRIPPKLSRGRPQGTFNGQGKHPKKNTNNGVEKKTRKPRKKRLNKSKNAKFNNTIKELLNHECVDGDENNNNNSLLYFYNGLTPYSPFQSTLPIPSYSFTSSHDTYDINNNNTVFGSSNSPIQAPFSFFDISNRFNVDYTHQLQLDQIPPENVSSFVLDSNALSLTTNVDLDIVNDSYDGEVDPIQFHHWLVYGSIDSYNSYTPTNEQYVDYLKTAPILSTNVGNYQLDASPIGTSLVEQSFIGEQGSPYYHHQKLKN
nr:1795_t:CDS:1 [Entrophospora candida]